MNRLRLIGIRCVAALTSGLMVASLSSSCTKGAKSAASVRASASNWKATPVELKNLYPPNKTILDPIKFLVTTKEGTPVPNINVEFKAFDVTPAFNGGVSTEAMKAEILRKWSDGNYVMNSAGSISGNTCDAGFTREVCVGMLSGPSKVTNQNGEATVGFTTPNAPGGVMAVALRVPENSTASDLIEMVLIKITPNDDFANSGIEPLQAGLLVIPMLFDNDGRQVIQAGVPFNLAVYAPGIPNTQPGKGFMFDFATEGLTEAADGSTVIVPSGSKRCEFRNSQCIVPGGPFRVLKPTTLSFSARPTDPKFPVKPASISLPVITGQASQLILALSPDTKNIQNACADAELINKACLVMSADIDKKELYPMLLDAGGNWVESPDTVWAVESGPLMDAGRLDKTTVTSGKQIIYPLKASDPGVAYDTIRVSVKGKNTFTYLKYLVTPGAPRKVVVNNKSQRATVPFPAIMDLKDRYGNFCYNYSDTVSMKLTLSPLGDVVIPPLTGLESTVTKVGTLDHTTDKIVFTNGRGQTVDGDNGSGGFVVTRVPPPGDTSQWPKISVSEASLSTGSVTLDVESVPLQISPGPVVQTLWRDTSAGGGLSYNEKPNMDPVVGLRFAADQQYNFYLAGYDAAANYAGDISDVKFWGVNHTLDDKTPSLSAAFKSAVDRLFTKDPSTYNSLNISSPSCPQPNKIPLAGRPLSDLTPEEQAKEDATYGLPTNQPEEGVVFCGTHLGLSSKGGVNMVSFNSRGIPGTGRILAIPNGMYDVVNNQVDYGTVKIKPALSPKITLVAGAATKFGFEFRSAEVGPDLGKPIYDSASDNAVSTGQKFNIFIHAQDAEGTDSPTYTGIKILQVDFKAPKSWAGIYPELPAGSFECEFGKDEPGICQLPGTYMLADSKNTALLAVKQLSTGGVQGTFAKIISTKTGTERRLFFATQKGGPDAGAVPETSDVRPLGRIITADDELPLAVAVCDAGGSYIRDANASDGLIYEGFRSEDGSFTDIFSPSTGAWKFPTLWDTSYEKFDVFIADSSKPSDITPAKFYNPDDTTSPSVITLESSKDLTKYNTVFVPQNRFGKGFAVVKSASNPNLIGWPSSWWNVTPGVPEHIETKLVQTSAPKAAWTKPGFENATIEEKQNWNWVSTSSQCYDMSITIHDRKHNQLFNYTGVVNDVVFKLMNVTASKPNGVDDPKAGIFVNELKTGDVNRTYYASSNANRMNGPYRDGFYIVGMDFADGGGLAHDDAKDSAGMPIANSLNDWWKGQVNITTGVIGTGLKVCLFNGQTMDNYQSAAPYAEKFIQVDIPAFETADRKFSFPAIQSRGAGISFVGPNGQLIQSLATPHSREDKLTVFRSDVDHLHPTFVDSISAANPVGNASSFTNLNTAVISGGLPAIGVTDKCPAPRCGKSTIYWHEHDGTHNYMGPARTAGFQTISNLPGGAKPGATGILGSPSSLVFDDGESRLVDTRSPYSLYARNSFVSWWQGSSDYNYKAGAKFNVVVGPPVSMSVTRTGPSTLTADTAFGAKFELFDVYGNAAGVGGYVRNQGDKRSDFSVARTLSAYFDNQPSNGPLSGQPKLMSRTGAGLANPASPVAKGFQAPMPGGAANYQLAFSATSDNIQLVKADEPLNLIFTIKDDVTIPWCGEAVGNCPSQGFQSLSATMPVSVTAGAPKSTVITSGVGIAALEYPAQGSTDPASAFATIFNTNPATGDTYPLGPSLSRVFRTYACAKDQFGNLGECASNNNFEFVGQSTPEPAEASGIMTNVGFFAWRATKPGSFSIKATKNGFTAVTAPISVSSRPLNGFSFENITTDQNVAAGSDFQFKVCMIDEARNVITGKVFGDQGQVVTDPDLEITVGFSLFGMAPNAESRSLLLSKSGGSSFDTDGFDFSNAKIKFNQGCSTLYARLYAAGTYNRAPLLTMTYIDPNQGSKPMSGSGIVVNSVLPGSFDHYGTKISKAPLLAGAAVVPALSNPDGPGTNVPATTAGGNRFDLTVFARDVYGNNISYNGNFTIGLQLQSAASPSSLQLTCASPANDSACLSQTMNGSDVVIPNLAMDIPGSYFVFAENSGGVGRSLENSAVMTATASLKTIKEYRVDLKGIYSPSNGPMGLKVSALDNKGNLVAGIADQLNNPGLTFSWIDEVGDSLSTRLPPYGMTANPRYKSSCQPYLGRPVFDNTGVALFGNSGASAMKLTKTETLKVNIRDNQVPNVSSNNTDTIQILQDNYNYDITCNRVSDGSDCTGTAANPVLMDASPENRFNLTVSVYDNCGNPAVASNQVGVTGFVGRLESSPANPDISFGPTGYTSFSMNGLSEKTFSNIFIRAVGQASFSIVDPAASGPTSNGTRTYHAYRATKATVFQYAFDQVSSTTLMTGQPMTFKLTALDSANQPIVGIDNVLRDQVYSWKGGSIAPNNETPDYPPSTGLQFSNGVTNTLSVTFKKAEQILDFYVIDDFVPGASGVLGYGTGSVPADPTGKRRSLKGGTTNPIIVSVGLPNKFVLSTASSTVKAGSPFDVKVTVFDKFENLLTSYGSDTLKFAWTGASSSVGSPTNPVNVLTKPAELLADGTRTFDAGTASFASTGTPFVLYRSNANALAPQERPVLTVTGTKAGAQTETGNPLTASLTFTVQPSDTIAYAKITDASTFDAASNFSGKGLTMSNDQTKIFFGHLFDPWGNYIGTSPQIAWTGSSVLDGKLAPTPSLTTTLSPTLAGSGVVTASCSAIAAGCVSDSTGTISVNPSPLVSFGVTQVSPAEGGNVAAGDDIALKVCMRDKNQQVITSPVVINNVTVTDPNASLAGIGIDNSINITKNHEDRILDLSLGSGSEFSTKKINLGSNLITFKDGCFDLFARIYAAGTYGTSKPLITLNYTDIKQNNLPIGGSGLKVGTVTAGALDHYNTAIFNTIKDANDSYTGKVPAWSEPSGNVYAENGGSRFGISIQAIDAFGNMVPVTKSVTIGLVRKSDLSVVSSQRLKCLAPNNNQSCLLANFSNVGFISIPFVAIDIPGEFYISATDGSKVWTTPKSYSFTALPSVKTVKYYAVTSPTSAVAGQDTPIRVEARDAADQVVTGTDTELRGLTFSWLDGDGVALNTGHISPAPSSTAPIVPSALSFNAGVANANITLTRAESGLRINVKDNQASPLASNNLTSTTVAPGTSLYYAITCSKVTGGSDCTGTSAANAASILASPTDMFNLQLRAFDQYQNPKNDGANLPAIKLTWESGTKAPAVGQFEQSPLQNGMDGQYQFLVPMAGQSQGSILNLFHRAGPHVLSLSVDPNSANYVGMSQRTFHSYQAHIDMVSSYGFSPDISGWPSPAISGTTSMVAGTPQNFTLIAYDRAANIARDIDSQLSAQRYLWRGPNPAPNGTAPILPGPMTGSGGMLSFNNGQVTGLSATFFNAETIPDFFVVDNYVPGPSGVGGGGVGGARRSHNRSIANPLNVINATPSEYVISTDKTTLKAGSKFDVQVAVIDQFKNPATTWLNDYLTFTWDSGGSPTLSNPSSAAMSADVSPAGLRSFSVGTATFQTSDQRFVLYKAPETSVLKVTGQTPRASGQPVLSGTLSFTSEPSLTAGYVKIASSATFDGTTSLSGVGFNMATNDVRTLYAHLFDPWGNYRGNTASVSWSGTDKLANKMTPTSAAVTTLTANEVGSGFITANCSSLDANCKADTTGIVSVGASPLKDFIVEHAGGVAEGATVSAGTEIPMRVCMLDKSGNRITGDVFVNSVLTTKATDPALAVTIYPLAVPTTIENNSLHVSRASGTNFNANIVPLNVATTLPFTNGCAPFWVKLYGAATYTVSDARVQINHTATLQNNLSVSGSGLKLSAVTALGLDHFVVSASKTSATPQANSIFAQATPDNVYADAGGSRFDVDVSTRDQYGNQVNVSNQTITLSTIAADKVTPRTRPLVCPTVGTGCLTKTFSGTGTSITGLAIDVGGFSFYPVATSGSVATLITNGSIPMYAASSAKTVAQYVLSYPTTATAGSTVQVNIEAQDLTGAKVVGADSQLNGLTFTWYDGETPTRNLLSTHTAPDGQGPTNVAASTLSFSGGSTTRSIALTKAETGLRINLQDSQTTPVTSTSTASINVGVGSQTRWSISCTRISPSSDCTGTSGAPVAMTGSAADKFNLTLKVSDQYKNPKVITASPQIQVTRVSGAGGVAPIEQFPSELAVDNGSRNLVVPMVGVSEITVSNLFRRSATQSISISIAANSAPYDGMYTSVYHSYTPTIDSVTSYAITGVNWGTVQVGVPYQVSISAIDRSGNAIEGIAAALNSQSYSWTGIGVAPSGQAPTLPGVANGNVGPVYAAPNISFDTTGVAANQTLMFTKSETLLSGQYQFRDNYNGVGGNGGVEPLVASYRQTPSYGNIAVKHAPPSQYALSSASTTPLAGAGFDVTVSAFDEYLNPATSWASDSLTFAWSGASSSITNPKTAAVLTPSLPATNPVNATFANGVFTTSGAPFKLYRSNLYALTPQEVSTLTVTGSVTNGTKSGTALSKTLQFTTQPAAALSYVKIGKADTFSDANNMSGQALTFSNNQTLNLYAHMFDAFGNYKGNSTSLAWSGTGNLNGNVSPTSGTFTTVNPIATGTGKVVATCSTNIAGCVDDQTGDIGVKSAPLASFSIEHVSSPAEGAAVAAGDEIALKICMRDSKSQIITQTVVDANDNTITNPDASLTLTFAAINIQNTPEKVALDLSTLGSANYNGVAAGARTVQFTAGCSNFFAKVYKSGTYGATLPLLSVTYSDTNQQGITIAGSGLKLGSVAARTLDHYVTSITNLSSSPQANSTQAWSNPGSSDTYANAGGNRFTVIAYARDMYGNPVISTSQTVNLSLVISDGSTDAGRSLICSATASPANGTSCLNPVITNSDSVTVNGLAVDIGAQSFFVKATDSSNRPFFGSGYSTMMFAATSRKTVKEYIVSAPATAVAGVNANVTVTAVDNSGSTIIGADSDLNSLGFEWTDGVNLLSTHTAPDLVTAPVLPRPASSAGRRFNAGVATINLSFVKAESGLKINIRDNQVPAVSSNNISTTDVSAGLTLTYQLSCIKDTGAGGIAAGQDCTGTSGSPASVLASATDRFTMAIRPYDQYKNPRSGNATEVLQVDLIDGTAGGANKGFLEQTPSSLVKNANSDLIVDVSNSAGITVPGLFHRAGNHVVSYSIATRDSSKWGLVYHNFAPSINMVYSYDMSSIAAHTAGSQRSFTITARDRAGNIARNIDTVLKAQAFSWIGASASPAPDYPSTVANSINFTNGVSDSLNVTFKKAETVPFYVQDNYVPAVAGIGGAGTGLTRASSPQSIVVSNASASSFVMNPATLNPSAGVGFGVTVQARDTFGNVVANHPTETLTFAWTNASSSVTNPKTSTVFNPVSTSRTSGTLNSGVFTSGNDFFLYRTGEVPVLRVTGATSTLTTTANFTPTPNANHGYVLVTSALDYNPATELSGPRDITTDQTATLYAHMFDDFGNWKGNSFSVAWSGSGQLANKLTTPGFASTLAPNLQGSGTVTATCSGLTAGCVSYTTGLYTVNPGLVSKFVWLNPTPATINQTTENCIEYQLQVQDQQNNPVNVSADYGITFRAVKAGVTDTSGDFFASLTQCQSAQAVADVASLNTAGFHNASTLAGSAGNRVANILQGSNAVSVWYANRTTTSAGAASLTATSGTVSATRTGQINAGPTKRFAITSSAMSINASGAGSVAPNCGALTYKFQDKWQNDTSTTAASTINLTSSSPNATGRFYSDNTCQTQIASGSRAVNSGAATDTVWYNDSQANSPTLALATSSTLSGNAVLAAQSIGATVNPGAFSVTTPTSGSTVKDVNGTTGPQFSWGVSIGARDYTVTYGPTSTCGTTLSNATTLTSANLPVNQNGTFFICVRANGFTGTAPGTPQLNASTNATYSFLVDNVAPTGAITVPASGITYIGPVTPATHTALVNTATTTVFAGTASDAGSAVSRVDITLQRTSNSQYWTGSGWSATETWLQATGTTSWKYEIADGSFVDGAAYTLRARVTDSSQNQSTLVTKAFTWKSTATSAVIASGMPGANSKWTNLGTNTGVLINDANSLVTHYTYAVVSGSTCPAAIGGYASTFNPVATKITDTLPTNDGQYTLCVLGRDEAGNVQAVGSPTSQSWTKDTAAPTITAMPTVTVNSAHAAAPTVNDNIDAVANMTYAWSYVSSPDGRCTGASFTAATAKDTSISATGCSTPSVPNTNWGTVTVRLTVTDRASNSSTSDLNIRWDQQAPYVASITSSVAANSNCRVGFCGATAQANIPISIVFTKDTGNFNRNSFNLTVSGSPTMNLNVLSGASVARTAALTAGNYTNVSGNVTVPATYTIQSGDASGFAGGVILNVASAAPFNNISSIVDNTGATGTVASNAGVPTTGTNALSNRSITIDTVVPTATAALANAAVGGYINDDEKNLTTALVAAAVGAETLSSTDVPQYKVIPLATACDASVTDVSTTIPTPSSAGMASLAEGTYRVCMRIVDLAGNVGFSVSNNIIIDRTFPVFTSINVPVTAVNNTTVTTSDVGNTLNSSGADAATNPITYAVTKNATCDGNITYGTMPKISNLNSDGIWYLCVRLEDIAGNVRFGQAASSINRQTVAAQLTAGTFQWTGDAANYFLNITEQSGSGDVLTAATADKTGVTFRYAITSTVATDCSALTYSSTTLPAKTGFTPSGTYKACVQMTDAVGNLSYAATSDSQNLVVDLAAPTLTFNLANAAQNGYVNAGARSSGTQLAMVTESSISADMVAGSKRYKVIASATICNNAAVGSSTQTTIPTPSSTDFSGEGSYKICMMAQDTAGNVGYVSSGNIVLDTVLPTLGTLSLANSAVGGYINDGEKAHTTALVSYSGGDGTNAVYQVTTTATDAATCAALAAGSYSSTVPTPNGNLASDATYRVCVRVQDAALNYSYAISSNIVRDTSLPTRSSGFDWINDAANFFINATEKTAANAILSAAVTSDGTIEYAIGTAASCAAMPGYITTLVNMSNIGVDNTAYRACVRMTDVAGNVNYYSPTSTLNVDTVTPTLAFSISPPGNRSNVGATGNTSFTIQPTTTDTVRYYYSVTSGNNSCTGQTYTAVANTNSVSINISALSDGTITLCTQAEDSAGNRQSAANATVSQWIKDTVAPTAMTITGPASQVSTSTPTVTWTTPAWVTTSDNHTIELYIATDSTCTVGNRRQSYASIAGVASTTQTQALTALNDGLYYICMFVSDQATNKSSMITSSFEVETDIVHFSYTDNNNVMYARYQGLAWTTETVAANAGGITYDDRTSLQLDNSGTPFVSYKVNDGTNTSFRYSSRNGANSWATASTVQTIASATSTDVGNFNEIAINTLPRLVSAFIGRVNSDYGLYMGVNIGDGGASQVAGSPGQFTDAAVAVGPSSNTLFAAAAQSGTLVMVVRDTSTATIPAANLPSGCSVQKVSAVAKSDSVVSVALVCSFASSCGVRYADITYSGGTFTSPASASWTSVGTIKSSSCAGLADSERPTIMVDRQNSNAVGIAWESQGGTNHVNFWTNRSGSGVNTQVVSGASAFSEQSLAFDSFGNAYIAYKDGNTFRIVTNNNGSWVSSTAVSGGGLSAIGSIGITGMKGRGNTTSGK